jgi:hypothetical protein
MQQHVYEWIDIEVGACGHRRVRMYVIRNVSNKYSSFDDPASLLRIRFIQDS